MKKVLLLGDSIRMGYDDDVKKLLEGKAEVYYCEDNGRFAEYMLRTMENWKSNLKLDKVDLVHWNCGLWDLLHLNTNYVPGDQEAEGCSFVPQAAFCQDQHFDKEPLTPPDMYFYMIGRVQRRIRQLFPGAISIFALTTTVLEGEAKWAYRSNTEIQEYNKLAVKALAPYGTKINDLYSFVEKNCTALHADWVHFNAEGSRLIAEEVVRSICDSLNI